MSSIKKLFLTSIAFCACAVSTQAQEIFLNLQNAINSPSSIEINVNKNKFHSDLIKLITLEGMSSNTTIDDHSKNKKSFAKYFLSGDDKFSQSNITSAYSDYSKAISASNDNDFQALLLAYKLANIGFFTLAQQSINQITDTELYKSQTDSIKNIFFPTMTLTYDEEILLAELYADIYYNNLAKETTKELSKQSNLLKKSDYANYIMSQAYYEAGEFNKALNHINKAINLKKNSPFYLQYKAKILCETKNYKEALKLLDKIQDSGFIIEKFARGIDIQREFTLANSINDEAKSKLHLAKYFLLIGEYNRALKEANNSINAKKRNFEAYTLVGQIQSSVGEYAKAKEAFNKALSINKKFSPAFEGLGNIEKITGTYENTLYYYNQALKYDKSNLNLRLSIALVLNLTGNSIRAKEICAETVLKYPNSSTLFYVMSEIYPENQLEYLRKSLAINAFNSNAWIDLAEINVLLNKLELAEKYLLSVSVIDKENYKYYYVEGLIHKHHSNFSAAAICFKKSLKLNPNFSPAEKQLNTLNL